MKNTGNNTMNILSVIPARGGSKGIPRKNLKNINKKPLLYYTVNASLSSKLITKTIVSSDDNAILKKAKELGAIGIKRPKKLATSFSIVESSIEHALEYLKKNEKYVPDLIVLLQNTSPQRNAKHVDAAIKLLLKKKYDSILSVFSSHYFLWTQKNYAKATNYDPLNRITRQKIEPQFTENGAIYVTTSKSFQKSKCRISGKIGLYEMKKTESFEVDDLDDLAIIKKLFGDKK
jgi:N-acylneuraminate cytidylyltransferase